MKNLKKGNIVKDDLVNIVSYLVLADDLALKPGVVVSSDVDVVSFATA